MTFFFHHVVRIFICLSLFGLPAHSAFSSDESIVNRLIVFQDSALSVDKLYSTTSDVEWPVLSLRLIFSKGLEKPKTFELGLDNDTKRLKPLNTRGTFESRPDQIVLDINKAYSDCQILTILPLIRVMTASSSTPLTTYQLLPNNHYLAVKFKKSPLHGDYSDLHEKPLPVLFLTKEQLNSDAFRYISFEFNAQIYNINDTNFNQLVFRTFPTAENGKFWAKSLEAKNNPTMARIYWSTTSNQSAKFKLQRTERENLGDHLICVAPNAHSVVPSESLPPGFIEELKTAQSTSFSSKWGDGEESAATAHREIDGKAYELKMTYTRNPEAPPMLDQINNAAQNDIIKSDSPWNYGVIWLYPKEGSSSSPPSSSETGSVWTITADATSKDLINLLGGNNLYLCAEKHSAVLSSSQLLAISVNNRITLNSTTSPFGENQDLKVSKENGKVKSDVSVLEDNITVVSNDIVFRVGQKVEADKRYITLFTIQPNIYVVLEGLTSTALQNTKLVRWDWIIKNKTSKLNDTFRFGVSMCGASKAAIWQNSNFPDLKDKDAFSLNVEFSVPNSTENISLTLTTSLADLNTCITKSGNDPGRLDFAKLLNQQVVALPSTLPLKGTMLQFLQKEIKLKWFPDNKALFAAFRGSDTISNYGSFELIQETPEAPLVRFVKPDAHNRNGIMILVDNYQPWSVGASGRSSLQGGIWDAIETVVSQVTPPPDTIVVGLVNQGYEVLTGASDARQKQIALFRLRRLIFNEHDLKAHGTPAKDLASLVHPSPETRHANAVNNTLTTLLPEATQWAVCFVTPTLEAHQRDPINSIASMLGNVDFVQIGSPPGIDPSSENFKPTLIQEIKSKITNP
jgi:hypothetical protein